MISAPEPTPLTPGATKVLDAATRLFYTRGIASVGVDTIAAASGVTKRTLYDRFGSKDALVVAYLQRRDTAWWERWEERIAAASALRALTVFDTYAEDADPSGQGCAFLNAAAELPPGHPGWEVIRSHKTRVAGRLRELVAADLGRPAPDVAEHVFLLVEGAIAHQRLDGDSHRLGRAQELAAALMAAG